jgi:hypothetical protein
MPLCTNRKAGEYMILNQKFNQEDDKLILRNTIDCQDAIDLAHDATQSGKRSKNLVCMGYIPPEYWMFDPWLIEARKAQRAGDKHEYSKMLRKFFEIHPAFAVHKKIKYYQGGVSL